MWETVKGIPAAIFDGLKSLFIPSDGYFDSKIGGLRERFAFFESVVDTVQTFNNFFENNDFNEPPVITVNLQNATGKINYGTNAKALDMSWYAPYKSYVDGILSAIMWAVFLFNTFRALPGIIGGLSVGADVTAEIHKGDEK